jgi:dTDP-glucose 4,6-dehydratase
MKVLVTGAEGFIGSHLVEALVERGHEVRAFVLYNSFNDWGWLEGCAAVAGGAVEIRTGDVRDPGCVREAVRGCDAVLHLAALIAIPYSYQAPDSYVATNVTGTLNILQAARAEATSRVVVTSTSEVYGTAQQVPISESHPLNAQSPYAATKIAADQMALAFHRSFGTPVTVLRPFNTFGPRQSARAVIPSIIAQIAAGKRTLSLGAIRPTRDFTYVGDTVEGFLACLHGAGVEGATLNLGTGREISVGDLVGLIASRMGAEVQVELDRDRLRPDASEVERLLADNSRMQALTGWAPRVSLEEGIDRTIRWFSEPANLARYKSGLYNV